MPPFGVRKMMEMFLIVKQVMILNALLRVGVAVLPFQN
jgi:hypothetical protein